MVTPGRASVVLVRFPFSDLSESKLRPAIVLAGVERNDWILCQVTSNPFGDPTAIPFDSDDFASGSLRLRSFARPGKLFTASVGIMAGHAGVLKDECHRRIVDALISLLQSHP